MKYKTGGFAVKKYLVVKKLQCESVQTSLAVQNIGCDTERLIKEVAHQLLQFTLVLELPLLDN